MKELKVATGESRSKETGKAAAVAAGYQVCFGSWVTRDKFGISSCSVETSRV